MDQGGVLERLPALLLRHPLGRQLAQLLVHQRQQFLRCVGITLLEGIQELRDVVVHQPQMIPRPGRALQVLGAVSGDTRPVQRQSRCSTSAGPRMDKVRKATVPQLQH